MEAVGAAASILAIATAGVQVSLSLITFADQVATAPKRIQDVGTDVSVTAGTLQELGKLMKTTAPKKSAGMFNPGQVKDIEASSMRCKEIFDELKNILGKASKQLRDVYNSTAKSHDISPRIKLSKLEQMKWPFRHPSIEPLQTALRDVKGTLTLILQVVHLRHAQLTASLNREEQYDLLRKIAVMGRQRLVSVNGDKEGPKSLDVGGTEDSDSEESSEARTVLEAWSVAPYTLSDFGFGHFTIMPIPVSQEQIADLLQKSPQDALEVASMIESLSVGERGAILSEILAESCGRFEEPTIRSISSHGWTGTHDLFGKVNGRKFYVVIEGQIRRARSYLDLAQDDELIDYDDMQHIRMPSFEDESRCVSMPPVGNEKRRIHERQSVLPDERRKVRYGDDHRREQEIEKERRKERDALEEEKRREEEMIEKLQKAKMKTEESEHQHEEDFARRRPRKSQPISEPSDDDLVKSLLAQYTNFKPGEALVQGPGTPPPSYDETSVIPNRNPRPY